ncbi:RdRP-domain-containing protein [Backusella circina FSU 941]|nr:RdRP-domain-containing protein [Backusella circina FSU 941]
MNIPEALDPTISRCAKQVYHHLGLPNRSKLLKKVMLPLEVKKMKTLMSLDNQELVNVVKSFIQSPSQDNSKKTIGDFIKLLDNCLTVYAIPDNEEEEEADNIMGEKDEFLDSGIDDDALIALTEKAVKRPPSYHVDMPQKRIKIADTLMTPPASPFDNFNEQEWGDYNILSSPPGQIKLFKDIPWLILYEIGRFVAIAKVPWREISFETFKVFFEVGNTNPPNLFETMIEWNQGRRGITKINGLSYTLMEKCPQSVWSFFQSSQENDYRAIRYSGYISCKSFNKPPTIFLTPPKLSASNRLFRKYGYDRFLELKIKDGHPSMIAKQQDFFLKPFLLMHRTFRFLFVKDDTIILFATEGPGLDPVSIQQVVDWHIPIMENWNMTISKFASRMSLGYSSSTPTVLFKTEQIQYVEDVFSGQQGEEETCMTDGCGIISYSVMKKIMEIQGSDELPCAIQGRVAGAKGIWIIDPKLDTEAEDFIQIRSSQNKFKTGLLQDNMDLDPLHYTLDLVKHTLCIYPSYLNTQFIQSLSAGGVPTRVFQDILIEYIQKITSAAVENRNLKIVRDWVAGVGCLMKNRWETEDKFEKCIWKDDMMDELEVDEYSEEFSSNDELESVASSTHTSSSTASTNSFNRVNEISGMPSSMHEMVVRMLDSGFDLSNGVVASRITRIFQNVIQQITTKYRIEVAQSCTVTCIPDPTGTLESSEVFLQLSSRRKDEKTGIRSGIILGDVVVTRNPCGLKSDVQKVKAIDCPELRMYTDVIVFPIKGKRSLASKLSGGDYDGDIVFCCWDERIVEPLQSSSPTYDSKRVNAAFSVDKTTVGQEVSRDRNNMEKIIQKNFISVVVPDGTLGVYENWRTILSEKKSLGDEDVLYLSQMCAKLVDAPKQGLRLKDTVRATDRNLYGKIPSPTWFADKRSRQKGKSYMEAKGGFKKQVEKPETTMDHLYLTLINQTETNIRSSVCMFRDEDISSRDKDLSAPWLNFKKRALDSNNKELRDDMELIESLVSKNYEDYCQQLTEFYDEKRRLADKANTYDSDLAAMELTNTYSIAFGLEEYITKQFSEVPFNLIKSSVLVYDIQVNSASLLQNIKASLAYILCSRARKNNKYCYVVAFDALRRIKADACTKRKESGAVAQTLVGSMYRALNIDRSWVRKINDSEGYDESENQIVRVSD